MSRPLTAESDASFFLPRLKPHYKILDVGCGSGAITIGLTKYVPQGEVTGIDLSTSALIKAIDFAIPCNLTAGAHDHTIERSDGYATVYCSLPSYAAERHGVLRFKQADVRGRLPFPDGTFDLVFSSQVFSHLVYPHEPLHALAEMRRVLRPNGGILAARDAMDQLFYPKTCRLNELWVPNIERVVEYHDDRGMGHDGRVAVEMPRLLREVGFRKDGVKLGAGTVVFAGEVKKELVRYPVASLVSGDMRARWLEAGITEEVIDKTVRALGEWAEEEFTWMVALQMEVIAFR